MEGPLVIGGAAVETLRSTSRLGVRRADIAPGRGMMLLQARARLAEGRELDLLHAPPLAESARLFAQGGEDDFAGNLSFSFGGAILAPFANRIRGEAAEGREIHAPVPGGQARLPRNWGGRAPSAVQYAMHGLLLNAAPERLDRPSPSVLIARYSAGAYRGRWPSALETEIAWSLAGGELRLAVTARNVGDAPSPVGLGWHPYFALPSGRREQARLTIPASSRAEVNDYDEVLPTGRVLPIGGGPYDFSGLEGAPLGDLYLDDCFLDLSAPDGRLILGLADPAGGMRLSLEAKAPPVRAVQVYAPPGEAFVVIEPQYNLADPFDAAWGDRPTGMVLLAPGEATTYSVALAVNSLERP